jgi:hypothetical protein
LSGADKQLQIVYLSGLVDHTYVRTL